VVPIIKTCLIRITNMLSWGVVMMVVKVGRDKTCVCVHIPELRSEFGLSLRIETNPGLSLSTTEWRFTSIGHLTADNFSKNMSDIIFLTI